MVYVGIPDVEYAKEMLESIQKRVIGANVDKENEFLDNLLMQLDIFATKKSRVEVGDHIVRMLDGRHFYVTYVNNQVRAAGGVFSARATDGIRDTWGGSLHDLTEGLTFIKISIEDVIAIDRVYMESFQERNVYSIKKKDKKIEEETPSE